MDPGEDEVTALKREVREELQIELTDDNIKRKIGQYAYTVNTE
ncbi:MAG: hypothetical protein U9Q15_04540 [Patescibacteria group bacterium]|nr:hypothetical protein [Patescibacteria group bacterium]